jgi:asparagine synthase (glutamine-hydrolysing)
MVQSLTTGRIWRTYTDHWNDADKGAHVSIIFGTRSPRGRFVDRKQLLRLEKATDQHAVDGSDIRCKGRIGMGFQPFRTHERLNRETQPLVDAFGNMLTFDGRLDNHEGLSESLSLEPCASDSDIILSGFLQWGENCFSRLVGDWALALWSERDQLLYLARDHAGTRTLYFENQNGSLQWATFLETFFANGIARTLDAEYAAAYLGIGVIGDLTPYSGIRAVPAAHYLIVSDESITQKNFWSPVRSDRIQYKSDNEYEEHFLDLFKQAVRRRTESDVGVLAHLSGGMDSTSIVCMSDHIRRSEGAGPRELIDTLSLYNDSEPDWDEKPFFSLVENRRGKAGIHIATSFADRTLEPFDASQTTYRWPGADSSAFEREKEFQRAIGGRSHRVIISGIGGDEILGGVPTPLPELADILISGELSTLTRKTLAWALIGRVPFLGLLYETAKFTVGQYAGDGRHPTRSVPWLRSAARTPGAQRAKVAFSFWKTLPSSINSGNVWWSTLNTLPHQFPSLNIRYEYRYPYLDRDLADFLLSIPREQLVRPGQRRSLMRRSLRGIVPEEILQRKRKAYITRGPLVLVREARSKIESLCHHSLAAKLGFIDRSRLQAALDVGNKAFDDDWALPLIRLLEFELWLQAYCAIDGVIRPIFTPNDIAPHCEAHRLRTSHAVP